jgi:hypothetical protein
MSRLDKERQGALTPTRMSFALNVLQAMGYEIIFKNDSEIQFFHLGERVSLFPYTGWHTGKSIKDGRGINNLIKQLTKQQNG